MDATRLCLSYLERSGTQQRALLLLQIHKSITPCRLISNQMHPPTLYSRTVSSRFNFLLLFIIAAFLMMAMPAGLSKPTRQRAQTVPQCMTVHLKAAYLAQVTPSEGSGFLLTITNDTDQPIRLVTPFPTSAHWYAQTGSGPWLWRASAGSGGALENAQKGQGPLVVYPMQPTASKPAEYLTVSPHQHLEVAESMRSSPILRFRPGCERCSNPQDERYRAVLAFTYLPAPGSSETNLLACGLRSGPIVMPPLESDATR